MFKNKTFKFIIKSAAMFLAGFTVLQSFSFSGYASGLKSKIAQMICLDIRKFEGQGVTKVNSYIKEIVGKYGVGNIILFSCNLKNRIQAKKLISDLKKAAFESSRPPLMVCVDQEGGLVERFHFGRNKLKNNLEIGKSVNPEARAFEKGKIIGKELAELGINCDLAPVVDINSNPNNPVIGVRSFGEDAGIVSKCAVKFMEGLKNSGIISTAKHFPGHGDTDTDSHFFLPRINKSLEGIENCELLPFKSMIDNGVDMVMTAHIEVPKIENGQVISKKTGEKIFVPATMSKSILKGVLRDKLGFEGVVITDAMEMKAVSDNFGALEGAKRAILAGANIICMPLKISCKEDLSKLETFINDLEKLANEDHELFENIENSANLILKMKAKMI